VNYRTQDRFGCTFADILWPRSRLQGTDLDNLGWLLESIAWASSGWLPNRFDDFPGTKGVTPRFQVAGCTRDSYGQPLDNCICLLIRVLTKEVVSFAVSDMQGCYVLSSAYTDAHFVVAYKDSPLYIQGASGRIQQGG
jgi:hypothetical protein